MRRCGSDPAVRTDPPLSPVRELPLSARTVRNRKRNSATEDDGTVAADGDGACWSSTRGGAVNLRAKHAATCLLVDRHRPLINGATLSAPREPETVLCADNDLAVSRPGCQFPVANFVAATPPPVADQQPVDGRKKVESRACAVEVFGGVDEKNVSPEITSRPEVTSPGDVEWTVRPGTTSPEMTSIDDVARTARPEMTSPGDVAWNARPEATPRPEATSPAVDWSSSSSSEYFTPPTRRATCGVSVTANWSAAATTTKFHDAASQTPPGCAALHAADDVPSERPGHVYDTRDVAPEPRGQPEEPVYASFECQRQLEELVDALFERQGQLEEPTDASFERQGQLGDGRAATASSTFTRLCDVPSPQLDAGVRTAEVQTTRRPPSWPADSVREHSRPAADGAAAATRFRDAVDAGVHSTKLRSSRPSRTEQTDLQLRCCESGGAATWSRTVTRLGDVASETSARCADEACSASRPMSGECWPARAGATITQISSTVSTLDTSSLRPTDAPSAQRTSVSGLENSSVLPASPAITLASAVVQSQDAVSVKSII